MNDCITLRDISQTEIQIHQELNRIARLATKVENVNLRGQIAGLVNDVRTYLAKARTVHVADSTWDSLRTYDCAGGHGIFIDTSCPVCSEDEREEAAVLPIAYAVERMDNE